MAKPNPEIKRTNKGGTATTPTSSMWGTDLPDGGEPATVRDAETNRKK